MAFCVEAVLASLKISPTAWLTSVNMRLQQADRYHVYSSLQVGHEQPLTLMLS